MQTAGSKEFDFQKKLQDAFVDLREELKDSDVYLDEYAEQFILWNVTGTCWYST